MVYGNGYLPGEKPRWKDRVGLGDPFSGADGVESCYAATPEIAA